jgi:hypothetical protein
MSMKRNSAGLDPNQSFYEQVASWIIANDGMRDVSTVTCDRLRCFVPYAANYEKTGTVNMLLGQKVPAEKVLAATKKRIADGFGVGDKTMELLGRFLRDHGVTLADGWDGS